MCASQKEMIHPFCFDSGIKVYSLEEALYYIWNNWKETDYIKDEFIDWVGDITDNEAIVHSLLDLREIMSFSDRTAAFLATTEYYSTQELLEKKSEILDWEKENAWFLPKQEGDAYLLSGELEQAKSFYKNALYYAKTPEIFNNLAIVCMEQKSYQEARDNFVQAYLLDKTNIKILLNLSQSYIALKDFEKAYIYLRKAERHKDAEADIYYLYAKICVQNKNYQGAIDYLNQAITIREDDEYYYDIAKAYVKIRKYNSAIDAIYKIKEKNTMYYLSESTVHEAYGDYPAAIIAIKEAIKIAQTSQKQELLTRLASYYRLNHDIDQSVKIINEALSFGELDVATKFEEAKIRKASGKMREYQKIMDNILNKAKEDYRINL